MKLYTLFSESHTVFLPWFHSIETVEPTIPIIYHKVEQKSASAEYLSDGWHDTMKDKILYIIDIINNTSDEWFIYSDIDVQFFKPILGSGSEILAHNDIVLQNDYASICAGFFYCKINDRTKELFKTVLLNMSDYPDDQTCINDILINKKIPMLQYSLLPEEYFTYGLCGRGIWNNKDTFKVPSNMIIHHANYAIGIENKLKLLELTRQNYINKNVKL